MSSGRGCSPAGGPWNGGIFEGGRGPCWLAAGPAPWAGATLGTAIRVTAATAAARRAEDFRLMGIGYSWTAGTPPRGDRRFAQTPWSVNSAAAPSGNNPAFFQRRLVGALVVGIPEVQVAALAGLVDAADGLEQGLGIARVGGLHGDLGRVAQTAGADHEIGVLGVHQPLDLLGLVLHLGIARAVLRMGRLAPGRTDKVRRVDQHRQLMAHRGPQLGGAGLLV